MGVDLSQFHQVFIEESLEGLDAMEAALMSLNLPQVDAELINTIFRSAHSIKGGSATFGFSIVAEFTHLLETFLDQIRSGKRSIAAGDINLLLQSVDCMRELIEQIKFGVNSPTSGSQQLTEQFCALLERGQLEAGTVPHPAGGRAPEILLPNNHVSNSNLLLKKWRIHFAPKQKILQRGNDPLRIFIALEELGELKVAAVTDAVPNFAELDAESIYLAWNLSLETTVDEGAIREQFEWVSEDCQLTIEELPPSTIPKIGSLEHPVVKQIPSEALEKKVAPAETSSIRVGIDKIDSLINMVGELVIIQSMLGEIGGDFNLAKLPKLIEGLAQLEQNTRELQESVMRIRMLPLSFTFSRFPRMVRDLAQQLGKKVHLDMHGEQTELDKTVMEKIGDPLVHLVRNAIDHGIEQPDKRKAQGKPETGRISLDAYHQGGNVIIEIKDDGAGLDREKIVQKAQQKGLLDDIETSLLSDEQVYDLIFRPGFSTAETVSEVSGRGVGMDVVKRNIQALKGSVEIMSRKGMGSTIRIRLPLTLAIMDGQLVRIGDDIYIFPLVSIVESMRCRGEQVSHVAGGCKVFRLRDKYVPVVRLNEILNMTSRHDEFGQPLMVVVESAGNKIGVVVDELLAQQQVVIKSIEQNYKKIEGISGATILGDGRVALILDIPGIIALAGATTGREFSNAAGASRVAQSMKLKSA